MLPDKPPFREAEGLRVEVGTSGGAGRLCPHQLGLLDGAFCAVSARPWGQSLLPGGEAHCSGPSPLSPLSPCRKVEDLQFRVEEESITKGDLEVMVREPPRPCPSLYSAPRAPPCRANGPKGQAAALASLGGGWGHFKGENQKGPPGKVMRDWGVRGGDGSAPRAPEGPWFLWFGNQMGWTKGSQRTRPEDIVAGLPCPFPLCWTVALKVSLGSFICLGF